MDIASLRTVLPDASEISPEGELVLGGRSASDLAAEHGTPLIVFDRSSFESRARAYSSVVPGSNVVFAGKSFCCVAVCELASELGLSMDVCSGGELRTALAAGFDPERLIFHGNNKSLDELELAARSGVGRIVVDSFDEIERLNQIDVHARLLVRVTPGVEAHTHEYVQTGQEDSKFGLSLNDGIALDAVKRAADVPGCVVSGIHAHIGSQIFELAAFDLAIKRLAAFAGELRDHAGVALEEINVGGGLGIAHTEDEVSPDPAEAARRIVAAVQREFAAMGMPVPNVFLEPGRSLVGNAAVTLYRVGTVKRIPGVRTYVAVDGGMSDNIRPALYGARYEAFLPTRVLAPVGPRVTVCGKHCESGDILIKDVHLPDDVVPGDLLCIPATGAYTYSMANNYNRVPRPAVVMVENGRSFEIVRRETYDDLLRLDRRLDGSGLG